MPKRTSGQRLAGRSKRELLAIGKRLGEKRSSGAIVNHVDELSCPGGRLARVRDQDKALSVGDDLVGGAFGPRLQPTPEACRGALEEFLAVPPGDLPSYRPPFEVSDLGVAVGIVRGDAKLPKRLATALQGSEDLGTESLGR